MKHLKLLVLLLAASMTVFSYGQAGTGGTGASGGGSDPVVFELTSTVPIVMQGTISSYLGIGYACGNVVGFAYGATNVTATFPEGSPFGFIDTNSTSEGSTEITIYPSYTYVFDSPATPIFGFTVALRATQVGTYSDILTLTASDGTQMFVDVMATMSSSGDIVPVDTLSPSIYVNGSPEIKVDLQASGEAFSVEGTGSVNITVNNLSEVYAHIANGDHFSIVVEFATGDGGVSRQYYQDMTFSVNPSYPTFNIDVAFTSSEAGVFTDTLYLGGDGMMPVIVYLQGTVVSGQPVVDKYIFVPTQAVQMSGYADPRIMTASEVLEVYTQGLYDVTATLSNAGAFMLLEASPEGYSTTTASITKNNLGGGNVTLNYDIAFHVTTPGTYVDTLTFTTSDPTVAPQRVILLGNATERPVIQPELNINESSETHYSFLWTNLLNTTPGARVRQKRMYFTYNNVDSILITTSDTVNFKLWPSNYSTVTPEALTTQVKVEGTHDWMRSNYVGVYFNGTDPGMYQTTLLFTIYGSVETDPVTVDITAEVIDNTLPMVNVYDTALTVQVEKDAFWQNCVNYVYLHPENVDTIRMHLTDGSRFRLFDYEAAYGGSSRPTEFDSAWLSTSQILTPIHNDWTGVDEWRPAYFYLLNDQAGYFTDTLVMEVNGSSRVVKVVLHGKVTDWINGPVTWNDRNVIITLKGDSLIVSGSGSTSDYSYYPTWFTEIKNHRAANAMPKHFKVEPGVSRLGNNTFHDFTFTTLELGSLDSLGSNVFGYNNSMDSLVLPGSLRYIGDEAFNHYSAITKVICNLPADVVVNGNPFGGWYGTQKVVANTTYVLPIENPSSILVEPLTTEIKNLYVAYGYAYEEHETGYDIVAHTYLTLDAAAISELPERPSMVLDYSKFDEEYCAHVSMPIDATLNMSKFVKKDFIGSKSPFFVFRDWVEQGWRYFSPNHTGVNTTLLNEGQMSADTIELREEMKAECWTFMGLPFNQKVSDIAVGNSMYCIRRFDAAQQAAGNYNDVWVDVEPTDTLHAGEGFIVQTINENRVPTTMVFRPIEDAAKQEILSPAQRSLALQQTPAEQPWNANWNLLTNPYPCFYDTRKISNQGVITIYSSHADGMEYYMSFSLQDDYYVLQPHEAFFYQAAPGETALRMPLDGKQHTAEAEGVEYVDPWNNEGEYIGAPARETRTLLNFYLEQNNNKDHARVVLNDAASMSYEVGVDALKMFAPGSMAAQLYAEQSGVKQSILERPWNDGIVYMGIRLMESGDCTISLPETRGLNVNLYDTETSVMTNLSTGNYTFYGTPGENSQRFIIGLTGDATALENFISGLSKDGVKKVIENGHVYILRGSDKFDVLGNKH